METLVEKYPKSREAEGAAANLSDILYQDAQKHYDAGEYDQAISVATDLVSTAENRSLQQKGRFLLGQAYEAKGDRGARPEERAGGEHRRGQGAGQAEAESGQSDGCKEE